ncbi:hypothetical protein SLA2020_128580 [Shorea laevis]
MQGRDHKITRSQDGTLETEWWVSILDTKMAPLGLQPFLEASFIFKLLPSVSPLPAVASHFGHFSVTKYSCPHMVSALSFQLFVFLYHY